MSTIVRVILEFDDKTMILDGKNAIEWLDKVNGMCGLLELRGQNHFQLEDHKLWKIEPKE